MTTRDAIETVEHLQTECVNLADASPHESKLHRLFVDMGLWLRSVEDSIRTADASDFRLIERWEQRVLQLAKGVE